MKPDSPSLLDRLDARVFDAIYARSLVYNTCWEDPAVDRQALHIGPDDSMLVITSAGCNVLDYALCAPKRIHAVDANPRQTALLELKLAGIRHLDHADFFQLFGTGRHAGFAALYRDRLRADLSPFAQAFWDRRTAWFTHRDPAGSFYFHGLSGLVARGFRGWLKVRPTLGRAIRDLFDARSLDEQRRLYDQRIRPVLWSRPVEWVLSRQLTLSLLGVPYPQRKEVQAQHAGGVPGYVRAAIDHVFRELPVADNHFWQVYLRGRYSARCCPEYLKPDGFAQLKAGLAQCIVPHTLTVTEFLKLTHDRISKFVLLDHMDWMASSHPDALAEEWEAILDRATPGARAIFRSAHVNPRYLDRTRVRRGRERVPLRSLLTLHDDEARRLSRRDRVNTYAGFHIADLPA
ncbi:MAG: BtaA family protein [Burkholderiales bacterium]|nr:BtaA family protein [Burkholderiales bacterium]